MALLGWWTLLDNVWGATPILAKKNKPTIGTIGGQMTFQNSFTKEVFVSKTKYPPTS
jgi:hypothetical protein